MRRSSFLIGVAASWALWAQAPISRPVKPEVHPNFAERGVLVATYSTEEFSSSVGALVGASAASTLSSLAPYSLAVTNSTRLPISAVVVRYPRVNNKGQTVEGALKFRFATKGLAFPPGSTRVFLPDSALTAYVNSGGRVPSSPAIENSRARVGALFDATRFTEVTVSLDSVVLSDGTVIGPDRADIVGEENRKRDAEARILAKLSGPFSDADATEWLKETESAAKLATNPATGDPDLVGVYVSSLARTVLAYFKEHGRSGATDWLKAIHSQSVPLHRVEE